MTLELWIMNWWCHNELLHIIIIFEDVHSHISPWWPWLWPQAGPVFFPPPPTPHCVPGGCGPPLGCTQSAPSHYSDALDSTCAELSWASSAFVSSPVGRRPSFAGGRLWGWLFSFVFSSRVPAWWFGWQFSGDWTWYGSCGRCLTMKAATIVSAGTAQICTKLHVVRTK